MSAAAQPARPPRPGVSAKDAATKIQAGFRGMMSRKKTKEQMDHLLHEGKILAEIEEVMAWKMVKNEYVFVAEGTMRIVRASKDGKHVVFVTFDTGAEGADDEPDAVLEVFPMALSTEIPVTKHSGVFFVFPTVAFSQGVFVGLKVSKKARDYEKFIATMEINCGLEDSESLKRAKSRATTVHTVVERSAAGIVFAGKKIGDGIHAFGGFVTSHISKKETETKVSESTKQRVKVAQAGAASAVQMSGMALDMMQVMTKSMAAALVEGVESTEYYKNYKSRTKKKDPPSGTTVQAKMIAGELILGYAALVDAMFDAGEHILDETIDTTADVIEYRHGEDAGKTARSAAVAAKDGVKATFNVAKIGPKGVVKGAAKEAGKELVADAV